MLSYKQLGLLEEVTETFLSEIYSIKHYEANKGYLIAGCGPDIRHVVFEKQFHHFLNCIYAIVGDSENMPRSESAYLTCNPDAFKKRECNKEDTKDGE